MACLVRKPFWILIVLIMKRHDDDFEYTDVRVVQWCKCWHLTVFIQSLWPYSPALNPNHRHTNIWMHMFMHAHTPTLGQLSNTHTQISSSPGSRSSTIHVVNYSMCKAFMVTALSVHFCGAGPQPTAGLLPAVALQFSLSWTDKKNHAEQCVQLCT